MVFFKKTKEEESKKIKKNDERKKSIGRRSNALDIQISKNIQYLRRARNLKQSEMAKIIGVSIQQIQKYESGENRVSGSTLYKLAAYLGVPIDYFYINRDDNPNIANLNI